jgi:hypothetical protein
MAALSDFQERWLDAARRLGLSVQVPFILEVEGTRIEVPVLLDDFGAERGMLLVSDYASIAAVSEHVVEIGYGFSCLSSEPTGFDEAVYVEILHDWGWTGDGPPPPWYREGNS